MDDKTFDEQYEKARQAAAEADAVEPRARLAHYDRETGLLAVHLQSGTSFGFSPALVAELAHGSAAEWARVEVSPSGDGLHWQSLDADIGVSALQQSALEQLYARLETVWQQRRDDQLVEQLAAEYPQFKDELYDFFGLLIGNELGETLAPETAARSLARTKQWLQAEGFELAADAARKARQQKGTGSSRLESPSVSNSPSEPAATDDVGLLSLVTSTTGLTDEQVRTETDIPDVVMLYVEDYYSATPYFVREEVIDRVAHRYGIEKSRLRQAARAGERTSMPIAAFRTSSYQPGIPSFPKHIQRSSLPQKTKKYWLELAERNPPDEKT